MKVDTTLRELIEHQNANPFMGTLLALDPGETTGWAVFKKHELIDSGEIKTKTIETGITALQILLKNCKPDFLVYEHYRVYQHKAKDHAQSDLHTSQFIGAIKTICILWGVPYYHQMASVAKGFCTDDKLHDWGLYQRGKRHARDAVRHGLYFLIFNYKKVEEEYNDTKQKS